MGTTDSERRTSEEDDVGEGANLVKGSPATKNEIMASFLLMSVSFSANHGAVTGSVALASSVLGSDLGGAGAGTLYLMYTLSALFVGKPLVRGIGEKRALLAGLLLYSVFLGSFLGAFLCSGSDDGSASSSSGSDDQNQPMCAWVIFNGGSALGGFAAGFYWTAQGAYYSGAADLWSKAAGTSLEEGNAYLAGAFATVFLTLELTVKAGSYVALKQWGDHTGRLVVFGSYASLAVLAAFGMVAVKTLDRLGREPAEPPKTEPKRCESVTSSARLLFTDKRMALLLPVNVAFGFTQALINNVVYADIVKPHLGAPAVALLSGAICGVAALGSMPLGFIAAKIGKASVVWIGMLMFAAQSCVYMLIDFDDLGTWGIMCALLSAQSVGRATWEGANKAVTADYFPQDRAAAFSNVVMQSGGSAAIGFYLFPKLAHRWVALVCAASSGVALLSVPAAGAIHRRLQKAAVDKAGPVAERAEPGPATPHPVHRSESEPPTPSSAESPTRPLRFGRRSSTASAVLKWTPGGVLAAGSAPACDRPLTIPRAE